MDSRSKVIVSVIVGIGFGAALGVLLFSLKGSFPGNRQFVPEGDARPVLVDDWSDLNDSLGG